MRQKSKINTYVIVKKVFAQARQHLSDTKTKIHMSQRAVTGSANFFYKGDTYIILSAAPLKPLHPPLIPDIKDYLKQLDRVDTKAARLNHLLREFSDSNPVSDLFYVLPKEAHQYLPTDNFVIQSQEYIDNIPTELVEEILPIIQEQLLHNLLL